MEPKEAESSPGIFPPDLLARMDRLGIAEDDLEEDFIRGSGSGGQKINKTASCVQLRHGASGLVVRSQEERSRHGNRIAARAALCRRLEERGEADRLARQAKRARVRHHHRTRRRRGALKERMLSEKKHRGRIKRLRGRPAGDD